MYKNNFEDISISYSTKSLWPIGSFEFCILTNTAETYSRAFRKFVGVYRWLLLHWKYIKDVNLLKKRGLTQNNILIVFLHFTPNKSLQHGYFLFTWKWCLKFLMRIVKTYTSLEYFIFITLLQTQLNLLSFV